LTDYANCDSSSLDTLYLLITESLPYLFENKEVEQQMTRNVTFSINGFDPAHDLRSPWWEHDD